jgi:hypothetical protein
MPARLGGMPLAIPTRHSLSKPAIESGAEADAKACILKINRTGDNPQSARLKRGCVANKTSNVANEYMRSGMQLYS